MDTEKETTPWQQLEEEPDFWYARFTLFMRLGPSRSIPAAYKWDLQLNGYRPEEITGQTIPGGEPEHIASQYPPGLRPSRSTTFYHPTAQRERPTRPPSSWYESSNRWNWTARARAYDRANRLKHQEEQEAREGEMQARSLALLERTLENLEARHDEVITAGTIPAHQYVQMIIALTREIRTATGGATERVEHAFDLTQWLRQRHERTTAAGLLPELDSEIIEGEIEE